MSSNDRYKYRVWIDEDHEDSFSGDVIAKGYWNQYDKNGYWFQLPPGGDEIMWGIEDSVNEPLPICDKVILEFCTGLPDKNGKLIYEGDILKMNDTFTVYVGWSEYKWQFCCKKQAKHHLLVQFLMQYHFADLVSQVEVIGNIHENSELLKEK